MKIRYFFALTHKYYIEKYISAYCFATVYRYVQLISKRMGQTDLRSVLEVAAVVALAAVEGGTAEEDAAADSLVERTGWADLVLVNQNYWPVLLVAGSQLVAVVEHEWAVGHSVLAASKVVYDLGPVKKMGFAAVEVSEGVVVALVLQRTQELVVAEEPPGEVKQR